MNFNKRLCRIVLPALMTCSQLLQAQDFAGPDKNICPGKSTQIGGTGSGSYCYKWTPETGLNDPTSPSPMASPTQTTTYSVEVTAQDLSSSTTDAMTVKVGGLEEFEVSKKSSPCCWKKGDPISKDQFNVVMVPPDLEGDFKFMPPNAPDPAGITMVGEETVMAIFTCGMHEDKRNVSITVVDEDITNDVTGQEWGIGTLKNKVEAINNRLKDAISIGTCAVNASVNFVTPFTGFSIGKMCCSSTPGAMCVRNKFKSQAIGITGMANVQCDFPFPPVPALLVTVGGGGQVALNLSAFESACDGLQTCGEIEASVMVNGGFAIGNASIIRAQGVIIATLVPYTNVKVCYPPISVSGGDTFTLKGKIEAEASVTFASLLTKKYKIVLKQF